MSGTLGSLVVNLSANIAQFQSDMGRASQATEQAMNRMNAAANRVKNVLGMIGVGLSVDVLAGELNKTIGALADLDDMAQKTGASVEGLSKLGKVAMATGVDFGSVDGAIVKLAKNLNDVDEKGNKTAKALKAIGISTADLEGQDPSKVFVQIARQLQNYEDGAGKVALATDLMGKSAADLLPYMNDVAESIDKFAGESTAAAARATELQDSMGLMKVKYEELKTEILIGALPAATDFIQALMDTKREANSLTDNTNVDTWADDAAIGLARMADFATVTAKTLMALSGSIKVVGIDIVRLATLSPTNMTKLIAKGENPLKDFNALYEEREKIIADADKRWEKLGNLDTEALGKRVRGRIDERQLLNRINAEIDGPMGGGYSSTPTSRTVLNYNSGGSGSDKAKKASKPEVHFNPLSRLSEGTVDPAAADRLVKFALDETLAMRGTIDVTNQLIEADMRRFDQQARAAEQITAGAENIRLSLMSDLEHEQFSYNARMEQLRIFSETKMGNEIAANAWMEQETARHKAAIAAMDQQEADRKMQIQMQVMQQAGGVADQMYAMLQKSGLEQSALGKAAFLTSKGLAVAQIIMSTNAAAANAIAPIAMGGLGPVAGMGLAATIKALGYSSAAMTAGLAIAEASAEGGYDIPEGVNPMTQLHTREMVLPRKHADVIRNLADFGGGGGRSNLTLNYSPQIHIDGDTDMEKNRKMIAMAVQQGNADLVDRLQRAGRI